MSLRLITMCTRVLDLLCWIVYLALERKDAGKDVQIKAVSYSEATVISYELYKEVRSSAIFEEVDYI